MRHLLFIILSLTLSLVACTPPAASPVPVIVASATSTVSQPSTITVTPLAQPTETVTPTPTPGLALTEPPTSTFTATDEPILATATVTSTATTGCTTESSALDISTAPDNPKIGDTVKVTVRVTNTGCLALGVPQYRLYIESDQAVLSPAAPEPVVHYLAVSAGESDEVVFELQAVASGEASLSATVSYEVHIGYPGPAYWGSAGTGDPLMLTVAP